MSETSDTYVPMDRDTFLVEARLAATRAVYEAYENVVVKKTEPFLAGAIAKRLVALLDSWSHENFVATHIHVKSGGRYKLLGDATLEATLARYVMYQGTDGRVWVRPWDEFYDGRFKEITDERQAV